MNRRRYFVLITAGFIGGAGCMQPGNPGENGAVGGVTPTVVLRMSEVSDAEIARKTTYGLDDGPKEVRRFANRLVTNGSATQKAKQPPLQGIDQISYNGTVYQSTYETSDEQTADQYDVVINPVEGNVSEDDTVAYSDLPPVDREKMAPDMVGIGTQFTYFPAEHEQSELVPTPTKPIITWESGQKVRISIRECDKITAHELYHYTAKPIGSVKEYGARFRRQHEFSLTGLSNAEQKIVDEAIKAKEGYRVASRENEPEATPSDPLEQLIAHFRQHQEKGFGPEGGDPLSDAEGRYIVEYDGKVYWTVLAIDEGEFGTESS